MLDKNASQKMLIYNASRDGALKASQLHNTLKTHSAKEDTVNDEASATTVVAYKLLPVLK